MTHQQRITLAKKSLNGTSIGDAFGESFFGERNEVLQQERFPKLSSWTYLFQQLKLYNYLFINSIFSF